MVKAASVIVDGTRTVPASAMADNWDEVKAISERLLPPLAPLAACQSGLMQKLKSLTIAGFWVVSARRVFMYKPPSTAVWKLLGARASGANEGEATKPRAVWQVK